MLTNRLLNSIAVMRRCWETGVDLTPEPKEYRGSGFALVWDNDIPHVIVSIYSESQTMAAPKREVSK